MDEVMEVRRKAERQMRLSRREVISWLGTLPYITLRYYALLCATLPLPYLSVHG